MRKFSILAIALMVAAVPVFSQTFNGVIKAQVENGNVLNSKIKKFGVITCADEDVCDTIALPGTYANGGFTVTLPKKPDAKYLGPLPHYYARENAENVKSLLVDEIYGFGSNDSIVATFRSGTEHINFEEQGDCSSNWDYYTVGYWYVDRNIRISWTEDCDRRYSMSLKKGWNIVHSGDGLRIVNSNNSTWRFSVTGSDYSSAFATHFAKGTLGASGKTRPIEMFFQNVFMRWNGHYYKIIGYSKTDAAEDALMGIFTISEETKGGSCNSDENELKGSYDLTEAQSKTSGSFAGTFTACEKSGKLTKASFKGNWIKHSNGSKTPCNFEI